MKLYFFFLFSFFFFLVSSCTEDYQLQTLNGAKILTVEGCITDEEGPYLISITECVSNLSSKSSTLTTTPVTDAFVTITDDTGHKEELKPVWEEQIVVVPFSSVDYIRWTYFLLLPKYHHGYDSLYIGMKPTPKTQNRPPDFNPSVANYLGIYYTTSISGEQGRTYTLTVEHNNKAYTATDRMPYGTAIDSVVMRPVGLGGEGKGDDGFLVPHLYFSVPQDQENFYLFTYFPSDSPYNQYTRKSVLLAPIPFYKDFILYRKYRIWKSWGAAVVNDKFMSPYMSDYKLGDGPSPSSFWNASDIGFDGPSTFYLDIYMASISKPVYRSFEALTAQFYQDGGAFSHAPASPPTNMSNGAQGIFMATTVSTKRASRIDGMR